MVAGRAEAVSRESKLHPHVRKREFSRPGNVGLGGLGIALSDASGSITSSLSYDSSGNVSSGSAPTRYTYSGREMDFDIGLIYYRVRW